MTTNDRDRTAEIVEQAVRSAHPGAASSATADRIAAERATRGMLETGPRRVLINLAVEAGYTFTQIAEQLRSGRGDSGCETADEYRRRVV